MRDTSAPNRDPVPTGFVAFGVGRNRVYARSGYEEVLRAIADRGVDTLVAEADGEVRRYRGRGAPVALPVPGHPGERMVVRHYRRGGLVAHCVADRYLGDGRATDEITVTETAKTRGAPVTVVLGAVARPAGPGLRRLDLVSLEVEGTVDLGRAFFGAEAWSVRGRRRGARAAGEAVRRLHDAGVLHADLNVKNILLRTGPGQEVRAWIIDFDRARAVGRASVGARRDNLLRLLRSAVKVAGAVPLGEALRFLRAYEGDARRARAEARRLRDLAWRIRVHRIFWRRS